MEFKSKFFLISVWVAILSLLIYLIVDFHNLYHPLLLDCLNGGIVVDNECQCLPAFKGDRCEDNGCEHGGFPEKGAGPDAIFMNHNLEPKYHCECLYDFWGANCSICTRSFYNKNINPDFCDPNEPCLPNWYGDKCSVHCFAPKTCNGHGTCQSDGLCKCDQGWYTIVEDDACKHSCPRGSNNEICSDRGECIDGVCDCYSFGDREKTISYVGDTCDYQCPIANEVDKCKCLDWHKVVETFFEFDRPIALIDNIQHYIKENITGCLPGNDRLGSFCFVDKDKEDMCGDIAKEEPIGNMVRVFCNSHYTVGEEYAIVKGKQCNGVGTCYFKNGNATCQCPKDKRGKACEIQCPLTGDGLICGGNGVCDASGKCVCDDNYDGVACECVHNICQPHGICNPDFNALTNDFICECNENFVDGFWGGDYRCKLCSPNFYESIDGTNKKKCNVFCDAETTCSTHGLCHTPTDQSSTCTISTFYKPENNCTKPKCLCKNFNNTITYQIESSKEKIFEFVNETSVIKYSPTIALNMVPDTSVFILYTKNDPTVINDLTLTETCQVSKWSDWSTCSIIGTRVGGLQYRHRSIVKEPIGYLVDECPYLVDSQKCIGKTSTYSDCVYAKWNTWSKCSNLFSQGSKFRFRNISKVSYNGGISCDVKNMYESTTCEGTKDPCVLSKWSEWSTCDMECIQNTSSFPGNQYRYRNIIDRNKNLKSCGTMKLIDNKACDIVLCSTLYPCNVSKWSSWGQCDVQCGAGKKYRFRNVIDQSINVICPKLVDESDCYVHCKDGLPPCTIVMNNTDDSKNTFTEWSNWTDKCFDKSSYRYRFRQLQYRYNKPCYMNETYFFQKNGTGCVQNTTETTCHNQTSNNIDLQSTCVYGCGGYKFTIFNLTNQSSYCLPYDLNFKTCSQISGCVYPNGVNKVNCSLNYSSFTLSTGCKQKCAWDPNTNTKLLYSTDPYSQLPYYNEDLHKCPNPYITEYCVNTTCVVNCSSTTYSNISTCTFDKYFQEAQSFQQAKNISCPLPYYNVSSCTSHDTNSTCDLKTIANTTCILEDDCYTNTNGFEVTMTNIVKSGNDCDQLPTVPVVRIKKTNNCPSNLDKTAVKLCKQDCSTKTIPLGYSKKCGDVIYELAANEPSFGNGIVGKKCKSLGLVQKKITNKKCNVPTYTITNNGLENTTWYFTSKNISSYVNIQDKQLALKTQYSVSTAWRYTKTCTTCKKYYFGSLCETFCGPNTCANGGRCNQDDGSCICIEGFDPIFQCTQCLPGWFPPNQCTQFCSEDSTTLEQCLVQSNDTKAYTREHKCLPWNDVLPDIIPHNPKYSNISDTAIGCQYDFSKPNYESFFCITNDKNTIGKSIQNTKYYKTECGGNADRLYEQTYAIVKLNPSYISEHTEFSCDFCSGHGTCVSHGCSCTANDEPTGYSGPHCANACSTSNSLSDTNKFLICSGHGSCDYNKELEESKCICEDNYFGPECQFACQQPSQIFRGQTCNGNAGQCGTTNEYKFIHNSVEYQVSNVACDSLNYVEKCSANQVSDTTELDNQEIFCDENLLCSQTKCICQSQSGFAGSACQLKCDIYNPKSNEDGTPSPCGEESIPFRGRCCDNPPIDGYGFDPNTQPCNTTYDPSKPIDEDRNQTFYTTGYCHCRQPIEYGPPWYITDNCGIKCPCLDITKGTCQGGDDVCTCRQNTKNSNFEISVNSLEVSTTKIKSTSTFCGDGCDRECPGTIQPGTCDNWNSTDCYSQRVVCSGKGECDEDCTCDCAQIYVDGSYYTPYRGNDCSKTCLGYDESKPQTVKDLCGGRKRGHCNGEAKCDCYAGFIGATCQLLCPPYETVDEINKDDAEHKNNVCSGHGHCQTIGLNQNQAVCACDNNDENGFWTTPGEFEYLFLESPFYTKYLPFMKTQAEKFDESVLPNYELLLKVLPKYETELALSQLKPQEKKSCSICQFGYFPRPKLAKVSGETYCTKTCDGLVNMYNAENEDFNNPAYNQFQAPCNGVGYCAENNKGEGYCICPTIRMTEDCTQCRDENFNPKEFCDECYFWAWENYRHFIPNSLFSNSTSKGDCVRGIYIDNKTNPKPQDIVSSQVCSGRGVVVGSFLFKIDHGQFDKSNRIPYFINNHSTTTKTCDAVCQNLTMIREEVQPYWAGGRCFQNNASNNTLMPCDSISQGLCYCMQTETNQFIQNPHILKKPADGSSCESKCTSQSDFNYTTQSPHSVSAVLYAFDADDNYIDPKNVTLAHECWCTRSGPELDVLKPANQSIPYAGTCDCIPGFGGEDCSVSFQDDVQQDAGLLDHCGNGIASLTQESTKENAVCQCAYPYKATGNEYKDIQLPTIDKLNLSGVCGFCEAGYYNKYTLATDLDDIYNKFECVPCPRGTFSPDISKYGYIPNDKLHLLPSHRTFNLVTGVMDHLTEIVDWYNDITNSSYFSVARQEELTCIPCYGMELGVYNHDEETIGNIDHLDFTQGGWGAQGYIANGEGSTECTPCMAPQFATYRPFGGYPGLVECEQCIGTVNVPGLSIFNIPQFYNITSERCEACDAKGYTILMDSDSSSATTVCRACPAGFYQGNTGVIDFCQPCGGLGAIYYNYESGQKFCKNCSSNANTPNQFCINHTNKCAVDGNVNQAYINCPT